MNWDTRFASIVKETEQSLARVKSQLQTPMRSNVGHSSFLTSSSNTKPAPGILKHSGRSDHTASHRRRSVSFDLESPAQGERSRTEGGGAVMSLLTTRIRDQQKEIVSLQDSVASLQRSLTQHDRQLQCMQTELSKLEGTTRPNSATSDSQFQQFKTQVRKEIDELRGRLTSSVPGGSPSNASMQAMAQELHSSKRLMRGDIESIQDDISALKSKLRSYETDTGVCATTVRDVERKQDRLEKCVSRLQEWQQVEEVGRIRHYDSVQDCTTQLQKTKQLVSELQTRLTRLEHQPPTSRDSTLLKADLDQSSQAGLTFNLSSSNSSPHSKNTGSHYFKGNSSSSQALFSSLKGSGNNDFSSLGQSSSLRSSHGLLRGSRGTSNRPSTSRRNPLLPTSPLWDQSSRRNVSDEEDTLDDISILSSENGELDHDLDLADFSPSISIVSVSGL